MMIRLESNFNHSLRYLLILLIVYNDLKNFSYIIHAIKGERKWKFCVCVCVRICMHNLRDNLGGF